MLPRCHLPVVPIRIVSNTHHPANPIGKGLPMFLVVCVVRNLLVLSVGEPNGLDVTVLTCLICLPCAVHHLGVIEISHEHLQGALPM